MWDLLVLTAGNESQKRDFEILLAESDVLRYCREVAVIADYPHEVKIGSGGATMNVLHTLGDGVVEKHILLIHSGGLSQRMPHLSALGKIFATLPDGSSILEKKLNTYKLLPTLLPPGLLICASDVVEDVSAFKECNPESQMIAFATESSLEIAVDHGVFVLDSNGNLKSVLQKPSLKLLKDAAAVLPSGNALTDCFYWISWTVCEQLGSLWRDSGPCTVETCCYGDFMRPLGYAPLLDYIEQGPAELSMWRKSFAEIFSKISPQVVNLGVDSFFHMGTPRELKMLRRRDRRLLQDSKVIPTDHVAAQYHLLITDLKISCPRKRHSRIETQRIKWWNLKDRKEVFFASVAPSILPHPTRNVEETWSPTSSVMRLTAENTLGKTTLGKPKVEKATWFWNEEVQASIREKKSKYKLWWRTRQPEDRSAYLAAKRKAKKAVSKAK